MTDIKELAELALIENHEYPLILEDNRICIRKYMKRLLLLTAREDFKGTRGISSKKKRIQKKIINKQFDKVLRDYLGGSVEQKGI